MKKKNGKDDVLISCRQQQWFSDEKYREATNNFGGDKEAFLAVTKPAQMCFLFQEMRIFRSNQNLGKRQPNALTFYLPSSRFLINIIKRSALPIFRNTPCPSSPRLLFSLLSCLHSC